MKEALHDKYADEFGLLDFRRSGGKSRQAEAKRFLGALQRISERQGDVSPPARTFCCLSRTFPPMQVAPGNRNVFVSVLL